MFLQPTRSLRLSTMLCILVYGIIFPWCINSPTIIHSEWSRSSWLLLSIVIAILMGYVSATVPYDLSQLYNDWRQFYNGILQQQQAVTQLGNTIVNTSGNPHSCLYFHTFLFFLFFHFFIFIFFLCLLQFYINFGKHMKYG